MFEKILYLERLLAYILVWFLVVSGGVLLLGLIAGLVIWFLIQRRGCGTICRPLHDKPKKVWNSIRHLSVFQVPLGVIGYFLWLPVIGLNAIFAATLLEPFLSYGGCIQSPWGPEAGEFSASAIIAGYLLAAVQSVVPILFGVLSEIRRRRPRTEGSEFELRFWVGLLIFLMVAFQMGMAVHRSYLAASGKYEGLPGFWQEALKKGGPWVAGLLGGFIPIGEIQSAYFAFHYLLIPLLRGTLVGALWLAVGWHPELPESYDGHR